LVLIDIQIHAKNWQPTGPMESTGHTQKFYLTMFSSLTPDKHRNRTHSNYRISLHSKTYALNLSHGRTSVKGAETAQTEEQTTHTTLQTQLEQMCTTQNSWENSQTQLIKLTRANTLYAV
jgi:hypothetical protein